MEASQGKVRFSYKGNEVGHIKELPKAEYEELQTMLLQWRRKVSTELIKQYVQEHNSSLSIDIDWKLSHR